MTLVPPQRLWQAARILRALARDTEVSNAPTKEIIASGDDRLSRYAPSAAPGPALVLLHGVTARGAEDRRLVRLARILALEGVDSYVPHLSGLADFREDVEDLRRIERAIDAASCGGMRRVSILGFSLGGGYGLRCAANADVAERIARIAVVGGHHRLDEVWTRISSRLSRLPGCVERASENDLYCALGHAKQRLDEQQLGAEASQSLRTLLWNYCDGVDLAAVRRFVLTQLAPHWPVIEACQTSASSIELSPAGRLRDVRAAVTLLHAPDDELVPQYHAQRNLQELIVRTGISQSLLTTPLLEHIRPHFCDAWRSIPRLVQCVAELLS